MKNNFLYKNLISFSMILTMSLSCSIITVNNFILDENFQEKYKRETSEMYEERIEIPNTFLSNYTTYFFSHLYENGPINKFGSCGYVSIASYLSFFDSYWDSQIIYGSYGNVTNNLHSSPGIKSEIIFSDDDVVEYQNRLVENNYNNYYTNNYLQFLLLKIAHSYDSSIGRLNRNSNNEVCCVNLGTNFTLMNEVLNEYLYGSNYAGLSSNDYELISSNNVNYNENRNDVISLVLSGLPVIVGMPGHVAIAYDYDIENDEIYYYYNGIYVKHLSSRDSITDYYYLVPHVNHSHSFNYFIDDEYFCQCQLSFHSHNYESLRYNLLKHKNLCYCGNSFFENHNYSLSTPYYVGIRRYINCYICGASKEIINDIIPITINDYEDICDE